MFEPGLPFLDVAHVIAFLKLVVASKLSRSSFRRTCRG
jgi:hypothetical protein